MEKPADDKSLSDSNVVEGGDDTLPGDRGKVAPVEIGGRDGLDPTRYGDWEKAGRCIDF